MKLKNIVKILMDEGNILEVPGEFVEYKYNGHPFKLIVHESVQPWTPNVLDISEESTGCRCVSTDKPVSSTTKEDIKNWDSDSFIVHLFQLATEDRINIFKQILLANQIICISKPKETSKIKPPQINTEQK